MQNLSVLVIHNQYQQMGGEDAVVRAEIELLRRAGHRVLQYTRDNSETASYNIPQKGLLFFSTTWSRKSYAELQSLIRREKPDIAHFHNFLPLISPAAHHACKSASIPVVQTLHNYRLLCPAGTLFRNGRRCEACARNVAYAGWRGCYRKSRLQTAAVSLMLATHRVLGTWEDSVDAYLTPSKFCRDYFVRAGFPAEKVRRKCNFLASDPGRRTGQGEYALFLGRLSAEKGLLEMMQAWRHLPEVPLHIAGDGPLYREARDLAAGSKLRIKLLGQLNHEQTLAQIKQARFIIFPSQWYEPFGMGLLEAAACGVPAVASRCGAIPELVLDGQTGLLFDRDNLEELADRVRWAWSHPQAMEEMGQAARQMYLEKFTAQANYEALIAIYRQLLENRG